jgi:hypothetical protein
MKKNYKKSKDILRNISINFYKGIPDEISYFDEEELDSDQEEQEPEESMESEEDIPYMDKEKQV